MEILAEKLIWKNPDRFKNHRERTWSRPEEKNDLPPLLNWLQNTLLIWESSKRVNFAIPKALRKTFRNLTHHTDKKLNNDGSRRKRRNQRIKTLVEICNYLLEYTNIQTNHNHLKFLEIQRTKEHDTSIIGIVRNTGFSETAVKLSLQLLTECGFLKTLRRKYIKANGDMVEIPACRQFTESFFKTFGLSSMLKKQKKNKDKEGQHQKINAQATRTVSKIQKESEEFARIYKKPEAPPTPPDKIPGFLKKKSFYKEF